MSLKFGGKTKEGKTRVLRVVQREGRLTEKFLKSALGLSDLARLPKLEAPTNGVRSASHINLNRLEKK